MTEKVFWSDPYLTELSTHVSSVAGAQVTLERTIFYALSGGQESDAGTIGNWPVALAVWQGGDIVYTLPANHDLRAGDEVAVRIDWPRRYRLMRLHFAAEIVLELMYRRLPGIAKIGAHIAADKARIDFELDHNIAEHFNALAAEVARIVDADEPITSAFSDETAQRRYWKIDAFAAVPCGGTHLRRTGEVGRTALKRRNVGKGKERIEITLVDA
ncbi:hypothetical protein ACDA63_09560 [Uliginosibacterium sp. sgz301328]|uniref:hypothetical protein n=1 Tax=Uliginosibacterium sp. sgz301328 TaxID=3243764 RepID=UPI00359D3886